MRIDLIRDEDVLVAVGKNRTEGNPTYYITNLLRYAYKELDTATILRKLKNMEKRGLVKRVESSYFKNNISWTVV